MIRTRDLFVPNEALYQAEPHSDNYVVHKLCYIILTQKNESVYIKMQKISQKIIRWDSHLLFSSDMVFFDENKNTSIQGNGYRKDEVMGRDVIIACDFNSKEEVIQFLSKFEEEKPFVKIGMELFYAEGPEIVRTIKKMGHKIFLDLKLHDIPNTVRKSMSVLSNLDVDMCNVHAAGTKAMMSAAIEGLTRADGSRPLLIAVTQLTSTSEEVMQQELWIDKPIDQTVMHYAKNTMEAGLDGVVCSPLEAGKVHEVCGEKFLTITPGVRFADGDVGDQKRVTTPAKAKELGSDYIVVGRPITQADDPVAAYRRCVQEFVG